MKASKDCVDLIMKYEGFSPKVYYCPAGYPTIGYGHVVRNPTTGWIITKTEAEEMLEEDIQKFSRKVSKLIKIDLWQSGFDALVSFTFNLGSGALQRSTLRQKLNRGEVFEAANEFERWVFAGGKKMNGLLFRRMAEKELFLKGF